jgi:hypothetical protein
VTVVDVTPLLAAVPHAHKHIVKAIVAMIPIRDLMVVDRSRSAHAACDMSAPGPRALTRIPLHCPDIPMTGRGACSDL